MATILTGARRWWPALVVSALLLTLCGGLIVRSLDYNDGALVYALDDAYIHMSIARNFVEQGVWGITPYAYSSTSSSPLWTLLIAISYVPGVNEITPLLLNLVLWRQMYVEGESVTAVTATMRAREKATIGRM